MVYDEPSCIVFLLFFLLSGFLRSLRSQSRNDDGRSIFIAPAISNSFRIGIDGVAPVSPWPNPSFSRSLPSYLPFVRLLFRDPIWGRG